MKICFVADPHLHNARQYGGPMHGGINDRCRMGLSALSHALELAQENKASAFVVLGDLFDDDRPPPQLLAAVQGLFRTVEDSMRIILLLGNHEQRSEERGDHALGPLADYCSLADHPWAINLYDQANLLLLPYRSAPTREWFNKAVVDLNASSTKPGKRYLCLHAGIVDADTPRFLRQAHDAVHVEKLADLIEDCGIDEALAGHWHAHKYWPGEHDHVMQVGALVPTGWDNPGLHEYGRLVTIDTADGSRRTQIIPGPRFVKVLPEEVEALRADKRGCRIYANVAVSPEGMADGLALLDAAKADEFVVDGAVHVSTVDAQVAARKAATSARSADTLLHAVHAYVAHMPIKEDAPAAHRESILMRTLDYLKRGGSRPTSPGTTAVHIKSLDLQGFMTHEGTHLDFPDTGVVVITGPNGHGKSAIVEGVATALWNDTLRDNPGWTSPSGKLRVECRDGLTVERVHKKSKDTLTIERTGSDVTAHTTATKAQTDLDPIVGPFDVWRRASAFSSGDAAHYSLATDGDQKKLIESLLGLEVFEPAVKLCRDGLREAEMAAFKAKGDLDRAVLMLEEKRWHLAESKGLLGEQDETELVRLQAAANVLVGRVNSVRTELDKHRESASSHDTDTGANKARLRAIRETLDRIKADTCPTCTQAIPVGLRTTLSDEAQRVELSLMTADDELRQAKAEVAGLVEELNEEHAALEAKAREAQAAYATAEQRAKQFARAKKGVEDAEKRITALETERATAQERTESTAYEQGLLKDVERVLGLQGVRSSVLSQALAGLDGVAGAWLSRIAGEGLSIKLQPFTQNKTGGVSDKFKLVVEGAGGGSYKGASQGQRRRIDIALLFALSEVAAAARGVEQGTLFADEVFDSLDRDGVAAVSAAMREVAETRCVVVVTHDPTLARALQPVRHWHVSNGVVQEA